MKELALNILDIVQNSIRAKAKRIEIQINESESQDLMNIEIIDNGAGISPKMLATVTDPFTTSRTKRKVGLGLAFLSQHAELADGNLKIESDLNIGTRVVTSFKLNHFDRQPLGDIAGVFKILIIANPEIDFFYKHKTDTGVYEVNTLEIKEIFNVKYLTDNTLMEDIKCLIQENLTLIGVKDYVEKTCENSNCCP
jgi:anti-sigma regulatory factor (Ser/Thr protein kinase)